MYLIGVVLSLSTLASAVAWPGLELRYPTSACTNGYVFGPHCRVECGVDRPGGDYAQLRVSSLHECARACYKDRQCVDAQYHREYKYCYLKKTLTSAKQARIVDSVVCDKRGRITTTTTKKTITTKCTSTKTTTTTKCTTTKMTTTTKTTTTTTKPTATTTTTKPAVTTTTTTPRTTTTTTTTTPTTTTTTTTTIPTTTIPTTTTTTTTTIPTTTIPTTTTTTTTTLPTTTTTTTTTIPTTTTTTTTIPTTTTTETTTTTTTIDPTTPITTTTTTEITTTTTTTTTAGPAPTCQCTTDYETECNNALEGGCYAKFGTTNTVCVTVSQDCRSHCYSDLDCTNPSLPTCVDRDASGCANLGGGVCASAVDLCPA